MSQFQRSYKPKTLELLTPVLQYKINDGDWEYLSLTDDEFIDLCQNQNWEWIKKHPKFKNLKKGDTLTPYKIMPAKKPIYTKGVTK